MSSDSRPRGARLLWCLRSYAWMVFACVLALAAVPLVVAPPAPAYQADALIVARVLVEDVRILPRLGAAVFETAAVEARVRADPSVAADPGPLIPDRLSLVAAEDSVVLTVQGRDPDPATAARLANLGATALIDELNRGGAGVGEFVLQAAATEPSTPLATTDPRARALLGGLAGLVLGVALIALITAVRRPVVTAHDVESAVGVPLLGRMHLSRATHSGPYPGRRQARGVVTVARWLARVPAGRLLLVSPRSAVALRQRVYVLVAIALQRIRPLQLEADPALIEAARERSDAAAGERMDAPPGELVLVDGGSALEVVDPTRTALSAVAVVPRGIPRRRLRALAEDFMRSELVGVVLVDGRVRVSGWTAPRRATAPSRARLKVLDGPAAEAT